MDSFLSNSLRFILVDLVSAKRIFFVTLKRQLIFAAAAAALGVSGTDDVFCCVI